MVTVPTRAQVIPPAFNRYFGAGDFVEVAIREEMSMRRGELGDIDEHGFILFAREGFPETWYVPWSAVGYVVLEKRRRTRVGETDE